MRINFKLKSYKNKNGPMKLVNKIILRSFILIPLHFINICFLKNLCIREFYLVTEETFPSILSRSKVCERHQIELSPIETAIQSIEKKNNEIRNMYIDLTPESSKTVGSLTMALNGIIDAEVNGGIQKYKDAFLCDEYIEEYPNDEIHIKRLKLAIKNSIEIVGEALKIHRKYCPSNLTQLQEKLDRFYKEKMVSQLDFFSQ